MMWSYRWITGKNRLNITEVTAMSPLSVTTKNHQKVAVQVKKLHGVKVFIVSISDASKQQPHKKTKLLPCLL